MVVIENATGAVRAMVGGRGYETSPFNLATEGERQPGSAFKAFDLAAALEDGISPESEWTSKEKVFVVSGPSGPERFVVHNDEGAYSGVNTLTGATAFSDNSIYAEVGLKVGTRRIADLAHLMGITTPLSTNPAMTIGGLTVGVTPLDMAHAYETIAHRGERVSGTLAEPGAPDGIQEVSSDGSPLPGGSDVERNRVLTTRVLPASITATETSMLEAVVQYGTGRAAALGQFAAGKTGTTSNYGDAWFVGWDDKYTAAVWVGYPNALIPMTSDFQGGPVLGGTFPALIWHDFMVSSLGLEAPHNEAGSGAGAPAGPAAAGGSSTPNSGSGTGSTRTTPAKSGHGGGAPAAEHAGEHGAGQGTGAGPGSAAPEHATGAPAPQVTTPAAAPAPATTPATPAPSAPAAGGTPATGGVNPGG